MKKEREYKHIVKSEICGVNGAWSKLAMEISNDFDKSLNKIFDKYEGKISVDAIQIIMINSITLKSCYFKAMSSFNEPKRKTPRANG